MRRLFRRLLFRMVGGQIPGLSSIGHGMERKAFLADFNPWHAWILSKSPFPGAFQKLFWGFPIQHGQNWLSTIASEGLTMQRGSLKSL
jgi:hypothetical protein